MRVIDLMLRAENCKPREWHQKFAGNADQRKRTTRFRCAVNAIFRRAAADAPPLARQAPSDGTFYGTTPFGGGSRDGTIFRITPSGDETVLYSFPGGTQSGANPYAALIQGDDGSFYGTTQAGGNENDDPCGGGCGSIFKITPTGNETTLYLFAASTIDGALPAGSLIQGSDGNFYVTTSASGQFNGGTVFQITAAQITAAGVLTRFTHLRAPQAVNKGTTKR